MASSVIAVVIDLVPPIESIGERVFLFCDCYPQQRTTCTMHDILFISSIIQFIPVFVFSDYDVISYWFPYRLFFYFDSSCDILHKVSKDNMIGLYELD